MGENKAMLAMSWLQFLDISTVLNIDALSSVIIQFFTVKTNKKQKQTHLKKQTRQSKNTNIPEGAKKIQLSALEL